MKKSKIIDLHVTQRGFCPSSLLLLPTGVLSQTFSGKALDLSVHIVFPDTLTESLPKSEAKFKKCAIFRVVTTGTQMLPMYLCTQETG